MMGRHLATCAPAHDAREGEPAPLFRLRVEAAGDPSYWLDVEVKAEARLRVLDRFLRDVWLECCGHLSAFTIGSVRYEVASASMWDFPADLFGGERPRTNEPVAWSCAICGSPAVGICAWCAEESENPFFCKDHARAHIAEAHEGDEAAFLPVVNSPRMGVCGYTGPEDARYEVRLR
jgi:hypothetical protein